MHHLLVKLSAPQGAFLDQVRAAMMSYFALDQRRIDHALQVADYALQLLPYIDADPVLTLTAAYLHDIGIPEAERKHGSSAGHWQELEGPPVARMLLSGLAAESCFMESVAEIVGKHHTFAAIDSAEFRILWDADALVNFAGVLTGKTRQQGENILQKHMVTEAGFRLARQLFLKDLPG